MINQFPHMDLALEVARDAETRGEVPVGAVVVSPDGKVLASAGNTVLSNQDPTGHAEMNALRAAAKVLGSDRLIGCDLYVTLEPCAMCAGAIAHARIRRLYFGADDPKGGGVVHGPRMFEQSTIHHRPEVYGGIREDACAQILRDFFKSRRG